MGEITGNICNYKEYKFHDQTRKPGHLIRSFDVEWDHKPGEPPRVNVEMHSRHFLGALWNVMQVKLVDTGARPIIADEVAILGKVDAVVSTHLEKWQEASQEPLEGNVLRITDRVEAIHTFLGPSNAGPEWMRVWDLELGNGGPQALVEFRSEKPWEGSISEGDRVKVYGMRSSGNVLLATRIENMSNGDAFEYERAFNKWWS